MLVVISSNKSVFKPPARELAPDFFINESAFRNPSIVPHGTIAPVQVVNGEEIFSPSIDRLIVHVVQPAKVVNASTIYTKAIAGPQLTSYNNPGGKGDRTASISVSVRRVGSTTILGSGSAGNLVDGAFAATTADSLTFQSGASDYELYFDFRSGGFKKIINEFTWRQSGTQTHGTWVVEAWNGNGPWAVLKTAFTLGGATVQAIPFANSADYLIYRLRQVGGATVPAVFVQEVEFKIAEGAAIPASATSYTNAGGMGDRRGIITETSTATFILGSVDLMIDGVKNAAQMNFTAGLTGRDMKFDFATAKVIDEFRWIQGNSQNHGAWLMYGSNDDTTYDQLGTAFMLTGFPTFGPFVYPEMRGNVKAYRFYKMAQINGVVLMSGNVAGNTTSGGAGNAEIEFKIAA